MESPNSPPIPGSLTDRKHDDPLADLYMRSLNKKLEREIS